MSDSLLILQGHALDKLRGIPDNSIMLTVCSPPYYGLRIYGTNPQTWGGDSSCAHEWESVKPPGARSSDTNPGELQHEGNTSRDQIKSNLCIKCGAWCGELGSEPSAEMFVEHLVQIFSEVKRCLHPLGQLYINIGDSYARPVEKGGSGTFNGRNHAGENYRGAGLSGLKAKDLIGVPWLLAFALRADGWWLRNDNIWHKNGMPESVRDRCTRAHEYVFQLTKNECYFHDGEAISEAVVGDEAEEPDGGSRKNRRSVWRINTEPSAYEYCLGCDGLFEGSDRTRIARRKESDKTILICPVCKSEDKWVAHFAAFPSDLVKIPILAGTSARGCCPECLSPFERVTESGLTAHDGETASDYAEGSSAKRLALLRQAARERGEEYVSERKTLGWAPTCDCYDIESLPKPPEKPDELQLKTWKSKVQAILEKYDTLPVCPCRVLDPFLGSGTTAMVALETGRHCTGIELNPGYAKLAAKRCQITPGLALA